MESQTNSATAFHLTPFTCPHTITVATCNPPLHIFINPTVGAHCQCGQTRYENLLDEK